MTPTHERPGSEAARLEARSWLLRQLGWERTLQLMRECANSKTQSWSPATTEHRVLAHRKAEYGPVGQRRAS
jgi:hypothetical protein